MNSVKTATTTRRHAPPVAVLLAAGLGSRFRRAGQAETNKLLATFTDTQSGRQAPLISHALAPLLAQFEHVLVVTRPAYTEVAALAETAGAKVLFVDSSGLGESLAAAVQSPLFNNDEISGCLVCLGDMPLIKQRTLQVLSTALRPDNIVAPGYQGQRGHPVGFGRSWFSELSRLSGDKGARHLLAGEHFQLIEVDDKGILYDVDTPEDVTS